MTWYAIADDLSGAAEAAASLGRLAHHSSHYSAEHPARFAQNAMGIAMSPILVLAAMDHRSREATPAPIAASTLVVVDSDNRGRAPEVASARLRQLLAGVPAGRSLFLKFDSLLRGNVGSELRAARRDRPVLFCPAVPSNGRTVVNGIVHAAGIPLENTELWAAERERPASSVVNQLLRTGQTRVTNRPGDTASRADVISLSLNEVRSDTLVNILRDAALWGQIAVCDAETEDDLDRIATAGIFLGYALAGSSGLSDAVVRVDAKASTTKAALTAVQDPADAPATAHPTLQPVATRDTLFILGSASASLRVQLTALEATGIAVLRLEADDLPTAEIPNGTVAVVVGGKVDPSQSANIVHNLVALASRAHAERHLVLSGGETARAVLDVLGITTLHPVAQAHPGAVVSLAPNGRLIATRPGSYGAPTSLIKILSVLNELQPNPKKGTTP